MRASLLLLLLVAAATSVPTRKLRQQKSYEGYKVVEVIPITDQHVKVLKKLRNNVKLDFWSEPRKVGRPVTIMAGPENVDTLIQKLHEDGMTTKIIHNNVQRNIDLERASIAKNANSKNFEYNTYNRYDSIMAELVAMESRCPSGLTCETYDIGQSVEGRALTVFQISKPDAGRKAFWIDSTIHAREWLSTATVLKIMDNFLTSYGSDADATRLLDTYDWYFLPVMNPDGYEYSWDGDRYWRKNTRVGSLCDGVDLNRNYDQAWMSDGTSDFECVDTYGGPSAASEPETQAVQAEAMRIGADVLAWTTVHTYAQLWLTPYGDTLDGWNCNLPSDYEDLLAVSGEIARAIMATYNTDWDWGSVCETLYAASGSTMDYVKAKAGVKYTFTPELRGNDFVAAPSQIEPSFQEIWNGVKAMVDAVVARP